MPTRLRALHGQVPVLVLLVCGVVGAAVAIPAATMPLLGLIALVVAAPLLRSLVRGAAWSLPVLAGLAFLLTDATGRSNAAGSGRYLPTAAVVVVIVLIGVRADPSSRALRTTACLLFGYGILGTLYGRFVLGTVNGALPLIGPMVIACLPPVRNWTEVPNWRLGLRILSAAGSMVSLLAALARLGILPAAELGIVNHEKAGLMVLGVAAALAARDPFMAIASTAALIFAFSTYPAATYLVAVAAFLGTLLLTRWAPHAGQRFALAACGMVVAILAVLHIDDLISLSNVYFQLVGKVNNGDTREALYRAALAQLDHPLFSELFTGDITVVGNLSGQNEVVPVHNDYLSVTLGGGLVAAALLLAVFMYANGLVVRALPEFREPAQRRAAIALLGAINAAAVSAFANPVFMNPGTSAVTFALLAALVGVCRIPGGGDGFPADRQAAVEGSPG